MPETTAVATTGLIEVGAPGRGVPVPLEGVSVEATIRGFCSRVTVSQRFRNAEDRPIEAVYVFPLDEGAAVCGFEALIDGARVVGRVKEREEAFAAYDDALAAGHGAYLLDEERPDVFTASIGNLPPGREALVRVSYVAELAREDDVIRFTLPTTVSPRYAPAGDRKGVGRTPAEALNPPTAWTVPYGLELAVDVEMPAAIRSVESPSHPVAVETDGRRARVRLGGRTAALDRDFVLKVRLAEPPPARASIETDEAGRAVAALSFEPRFDGGETPGEWVFLVDRSGSMQGTSIAEARNALQLCLRGLRPGTLFNVVGFGSTFVTLFPESRPYGEDTLAEASRHVASLDADLGGTEVLAPLEWALTKPAREGFPRQLFLLTDGQVTNTEAVVALVRRHSVETRVFTFGIGAGASQHLVRGIARAGEGEAEMIAPGERVEDKVVRQLARAFAPALADVEVDWGGLRVSQAPHRVPPVFAGGRLLVYGRLEQPAAADVTLRARGPAGPVSFTLRLDPAGAEGGSLLSTLHARAAIRDLEEGRSALHDRRGSLQERGVPDRVKQEIVRLGVAHGLVSRHTSYVAVEERATPVEGETVLRRVPVALTRGWGGIEEARLGGTAVPGPASVQFLAASAEEGLEAPSLSLDSSQGATETGEWPRAPRPAASRPSLLGRLAGLGHPGLGRPAAPSPASAQRGRQGPEERLVLLQRADGSWDLTRELAEVLGRSLDELEAGLAGALGDRVEARRAWATALALAWLDARPERRGRLDMLADKAREWLARATARPAAGTWSERAREALA